MSDLQPGLRYEPHPRDQRPGRGDDTAGASAALLAFAVLAMIVGGLVSFADDSGFEGSPPAQIAERPGMLPAR